MVIQALFHETREGPDIKKSIASTRCQPLAVRRESHCVGAVPTTLTVTGQGEYEPAGRHVPQAEHTIPTTAADHEPIIRRERGAAQVAHFLEGKPLLPRRQLPEPYFGTIPAVSRKH